MHALLIPILLTCLVLMFNLQCANEKIHHIQKQLGQIIRKLEIKYDE